MADKDIILRADVQGEQKVKRSIDDMSASGVKFGNAFRSVSTGTVAGLEGVATSGAAVVAVFLAIAGAAKTFDFIKERNERLRVAVEENTSAFKDFLAEIINVQNSGDALADSVEKQASFWDKLAHKLRLSRIDTEKNARAEMELRQQYDKGLVVYKDYIDKLRELRTNAVVWTQVEESQSKIREETDRKEMLRFLGFFEQRRRAREKDVEDARKAHEKYLKDLQQRTDRETNIVTDALSQLRRRDFSDRFRPDAPNPSSAFDRVDEIPDLVVDRLGDEFDAATEKARILGSILTNSFVSANNSMEEFFKNLLRNLASEALQTGIYSLVASFVPGAAPAGGLFGGLFGDVFGLSNGPPSRYQTQGAQSTAVRLSHLRGVG